MAQVTPHLDFLHSCFLDLKCQLGEKSALAEGLLPCVCLSISGGGEARTEQFGELAVCRKRVVNSSLIFMTSLFLEVNNTKKEKEN